MRFESLIVTNRTTILARTTKIKLSAAIVLFNVALYAATASPSAPGPSSSLEPIASTPRGMSDNPSASPTGNDRKEDTKWPDAITAYGTLAAAIVGGVAAIAAAVSAYYSYRTVQQADATERERSRSAKAERFSALWTDIGEWKFLTKDQMNDLNSEEVAEIVRRNINSMGKVGFWWETNLIDRKIVADEIAKTYVILFEQISRLGKLVRLGRSGPDLIEENPSARKLYNDLKKHLAMNSVALPAGTNKHQHNKSTA